MKPSGATVSVRVVHVILAAAGGDHAALLARVGLDPAILRDPEARIPLETENRLWAEAARSTGDPFFGLHAATAWKPGTFDVFDYVCRSAPTLRGAVERAARYNRLIHDIAEFRIEERGERARIVHSVPVPIGREPAEYTLAAAAGAAWHWTGRKIPLRRIGFPYRQPQEIGPLIEFFGTSNLQFDTKEGFVEFDRPLLDLPLPTADAGLDAVLRRHADALLAALPRTDDFLVRIRDLISAELRNGTPTAEAIAERLHMSPRTLHRRLADHGTRFSDEVESLRRGLALRYLEDPRISIAEVAFLLGYSEARAFHRAFKSWTGETPGTWRTSRS